MTMPTDSAIPAITRPLIQDPDLASAIEAEMRGMSAKERDRARAAIVKVHASGFSGQYGELLEAYLAAIREAIASD